MATVTSNAVIEAIRYSYLEGEELPYEDITGIVFGLNELFVIIILATGALLAYIRPRRLQKALIWVLLVFTLVWLGFMTNQTLTLTRIAAMLSGYLPDARRELYLYLLLGGSILLIFILRRNVYCHSVCPFGSAQELLAKVNSARPVVPGFSTQVHDYENNNKIDHYLSRLRFFKGRRDAAGLLPVFL